MPEHWIVEQRRAQHLLEFGALRGSKHCSPMCLQGLSDKALDRLLAGHLTGLKLPQPGGGGRLCLAGSAC